MRNDKRRSSRKSLERHVWIQLEDGSAPIECELGNMSDTGAKLILNKAQELPGEFILRLTEDGRVARKCRVAWTAGNRLGVAFVARLTSAAADAVHP